MSESQLKKRNEIPEEYTWDLSVMFADEKSYEESFGKGKSAVEALKKYIGTLGKSAEQLEEAVSAYLEAARQVSNLYVYAHLKNDQDQGNAEYQTLEARARQLYSEFGQVTASFQPEILAIPEEQLNSFINENETLKSYKQFIDNITRNRPHVLSEEQELLLAQASEVFAGAEKTFSLFNNADLKFPSIKDEEGNEIVLTHSVYGKMLESTDRRVRKETFEKYYEVYDQFKNTSAAMLSTQVKTQNYEAKVRNYESARAAALAQNNVPESVYDTLLEGVGERLDLLHRYVDLRKELLNVDQLEMYDMYTPLLGEAPIKFDYEEAKEVTLKALAPLGSEYLDIIEEAFSDRWIDLYENIGKRSGAYSSGTYDSKPYILMNWQDSINHLYTLVHELGHSAHSYLTHKYQPYVYGNYSIFLAEIASTTNENLLTSYLLDQYEDPEVRLFVINHFLDGMKGTVYRQTQFAEFEHFMHQADADGIPLTAQFLSDNYQELNKKYYGSSVNSDSEIALEWSRIPHFYYNYYVFQYSTGFAAATYFSDKIINGDKDALEKYLGFLKSGSSQYPIDTMKTAGLDMTKSDYIRATLDVFEERLKQFEELLHSQK